MTTDGVWLNVNMMGIRKPVSVSEGRIINELEFLWDIICKVSELLEHGA